jgi:hypothetical protein
LSTLTKVLIVLLALSSLFLCGIVVTYVSSAENFKAAYDKLSTELQATTSLYKTRENQFNERMAAAQRADDEAKGRITELEAQKAQMQADLSTAQRSIYASQERVSNLAGVVSGLNQTIASMDQSLKLAREELDKVRTEQVKDKKNLNEVASALNEKTVQIDALDAERRRLLEEKVALEGQIARLSGQGTTVSAGAVTPQAGNVRVTPPTTNQAMLSGKIVEENLKSSLVTVSIGSADGVQVGTRLHVVRGDTFICDVVITNVEPDKSAGILELVRQQPKIGDTVSTNL